MRVAVAGAGDVGQAIAMALLADGHKVLLIERQRASFAPKLVPAADWMLGDACELATLQTAGIETCDVVIAATGDDKVNLVFAMLSKTEFAVPRVVARINDPRNQWLFGKAWGVDVAVSTPGTLVSTVDETVSLGDVVRLMTLQHGRGNIVEITLPPTSRRIGTLLRELALPDGAALIAVFRAEDLVTARPGLRLQAGDEVVLVATAEVEDEIRALLG